MRNRLAALLLIPAFLSAFISGTVQEPEETTPATGITDETVFVTVPQITETLAPATEPTIIETSEPPTTKPSTTDPSATEMVETEPYTVPEETNDGLQSLGTFTLTAYCPCQKCCGSYGLNRPVDENGNEIIYGSIGVPLAEGVSIAVDPRVIPYGTQVVINGHTYTAQDTGGSIVGNRIDVYFDDHQEALNFGMQYAEVFVYSNG